MCMESIVGVKTMRRWPLTLIALLLVLAGCTAQEGEADTGAAAFPTNTPATDVALPATATPPQAATSTSTSTPLMTSSNAVGFADNGGGGGTNLVRVNNQADGKRQYKSSVQLNRIKGPGAEPTNIAYAESSCTDCQSFVIALQVNLISPDARVVRPENAAVAVNVGCTRCVTVARAVQYTITVDDPTNVPKDVADMIKAFDRELKAIEQTPGLSAQQIFDRVNTVIAQFRQFADGLDDRLEEATEETTPVTPTPESTAEPTAVMTQESTPTDVPGGSPTPEPSATASETVVSSTPTGTSVP